MQMMAEEKQTWSSFHANVVSAICWRWGAAQDNPAELVEKNRGFSFDAPQIKIPALLIVGRGGVREQ